MTTVQITGGAVEYSKPSNYQANIAGAKVSLTFAVADGAPHDDAVAMLDAVANLAIRKAIAMSSGTCAQVEHIPTAAPPTLPPAAPSAVASAPTSATVFTPPALTGAPAAPPATAAEPAVQNGPIVMTPASPSEPVAIADKTLSDALTARAQFLMQTATDTETPHVVVRLNKLVAHFVPPPQKVYAIPQEHRQEFLDMVARLTVSGPMPYDVA